MFLVLMLQAQTYRCSNLENKGDNFTQDIKITSHQEYHRSSSGVEIIISCEHAQGGKFA